MEPNKNEKLDPNKCYPQYQGGFHRENCEHSIPKVTVSLPQTEKVEEKFCDHQCPRKECNKESCDGVPFIHDWHCGRCGIAFPVQAETVGWEERFDNSLNGYLILTDGEKTICKPRKQIKDFIRSERILAQKEVYEAILSKRKSYERGKNDIRMFDTVSVEDIEIILKDL